MELFDKVHGKKGKGPLKLNQHEAFGSVCIHDAVGCDGVVEDNAQRCVVSSPAEKRLYDGNRVDDFACILQATAKSVQRRGHARGEGGRLKRPPSITPGDGVHSRYRPPVARWRC